MPYQRPDTAPGHRHRTVVGVHRRSASAWLAFLVLVAACGSDPGPDSGATPEPVGGEPTGTIAVEEPAASAATPSPPCPDPPCYGEPERVGQLSTDVITGVSGMSASHRAPDRYYVVSDLAGTSEVIVIEEDGTPVAHLEIEGMAARNAEALAVGPCGEEASDTCLFIGDIGDHVGRDHVVVYRLPEPDLDDPPDGPLAADELRYTYPDSPTDAEALLVDPTGRPLIISKASFDDENGETGPTHLYRGGPDGGVMEHLGEIALPDPENPTFAPLVGNVVTGADAVDGMVLLRTYDEVLEYRAGDPDAALADFPDWPVQRVPSPFQIQSETVAYRLDGCGYLTTAEMSGSIDAVGCVD